MWTLTIFNKDELILEHSQTDFMKVLRFGTNSLIELCNQNVTDWRIIIRDKEGNVYYYSIGPTTQIIGLKKKGTPIPKEPQVEPNYAGIGLDIDEVLGRFYERRNK